MIEPYKPTKEDLDWCRMVVRMMNEGGMVCTSVGVYRVSQKEQSFTLVDPTTPFANPVLLYMHHRHHCCWQQIGYKVLPVVEWEKL
jgi:hypothetical protein